MNREFADILDRLERDGEAVLTRTADGTLYRRKFARPPRLILLGAGHVSQAVAELASKVDFAVTVADDRPDFANRARFPEAAEIVCRSFGDAVEGLRIGARDYVCVLTRGHRWDADCLRAILWGMPPCYLGMMGSRRRVAGLLALLREEGFDPDRLARLHAPIGLPIGSATPAEIAVSIVAELIQVRRSLPSEPGVLERMEAQDGLLRLAAEGTLPQAMLLVLETKGSAPAQSGALMLVDRAGRTAGTIGGGCAEGSALLTARRLLGTGRAQVISIDLTDETAEQDGMVCGGTMKVLVEDLPRTENAPEP